MLNHIYNDNSTHSVTMNPPCVGTLQKSHPKSKFEVFHKASPMAATVFSDFPRLVKERTDRTKYEIVVLQLMVFGDEEILIEYVMKSDFEE